MGVSWGGRCLPASSVFAYEREGRSICLMEKFPLRDFVWRSFGRLKERVLMTAALSPLVWAGLEEVKIETETLPETPVSEKESVCGVCGKDSYKPVSYFPFFPESTLISSAWHTPSQLKDDTSRVPYSGVKPCDWVMRGQERCRGELLKSPKTGGGGWGTLT